MKKRLILLYIFFFVLFLWGLLYAEDTKVTIDENKTLEELLNTNTVGFDFIANGRSEKAYLVCDKGRFQCGFIGSWQTYVFQRVEYVNAELCNVYFMVAGEIFDTTDYDFDKLGTDEESGYSGYTHWYFPLGFRAAITKEMVLKCIRGNDEYIEYNPEERHPVQCQAIVIDNLRIRSKPSINSEIIGNLAKLSEITLYEESTHEDTIDNFKSPWYKVKTTDGKDGWVFGGYVRIFFTDKKGVQPREAILRKFGG